MAIAEPSSRTKASIFIAIVRTFEPGCGVAFSDSMIQKFSDRST
jgi:hypothetical protein